MNFIVTWIFLYNNWLHVGGLDVFKFTNSIYINGTIINYFYLWLYYIPNKMEILGGLG